MKKLTLLMLAAAFALTPLIQTTAQAAPQGKGVRVMHLKKANHRLKNKVKKLHHKLHARRQHKH